jgi:ABC-type multidrug transport system permease subunit
MKFQYKSKSVNRSSSSRVILGIAFILTLIILSILANMTGWSSGAEKILIAALVAIPVGSFFTETDKKT